MQKIKTKRPDSLARRRGALCSLAVAVLTAGCAGMAPKTPEEAVEERARERMQYVLAEDYAAAYEYLSPGYRSGVSLNDYQRRMLGRRFQWNDAVVGKSECSEDSCKVRISIDYTIYGVLPGKDRFDSKAASVENWLRVDGTWYFVPAD